MNNFYLLFFMFLIISCVKKDGNEAINNHLGNISINVSGNSEAMPAFEEGMLLLHSFEFKDAAEKFREARELDEDMAMAYWGEAMTKNHPLWREQDKEEALAILSELGETKEEQRSRFKSPFEKDMFDAISILYGEGTKKERDQNYADFMSKLHKKYPDNHEVSAFYALSLLGSVKGGRDYETYAKGAKIAQSIIDENPNHPGALHYLIHSYDDPENAKKALDAANSYAMIAPDAGHALHMPSHIYVALGMWDEVISSNIDSWEASKKRKERKALDNDALNYHAFKWLMYGYLQKGENDKARSLVEEMQNYCYEKVSGRSKSHLVMMKAAYFTETNKWGDSLLYDTLDYSDSPIQVYAAHNYMMGRKAYEDNESEEMKGYIEQLVFRINDAANDVLIGNPEMCSGALTRGRPSQLAVDRATVMKLELEALHADLNGDLKKAEELLVQATKLETATSYMYGPPDIVKPSHELLGEWLVSHDRDEEAIKHFKEVLERAPGRLIPSKQIEKIKSMKI
ncbi:MAG: hypothetical protein HKN67_10470 [Saprospiraceae bacterium]|nr:hypothetical protein [Saprospiraceae bacterium]